jgi:hypothetical protein
VLANAYMGFKQPAGTDVDNIHLSECNRYIWFLTDGATFKNLKGVGASDVAIRAQSVTTSDMYLVNPDFDVYTFNWSGCTKVCYRQYEFDLSTDAGATVTLKDNAGTTVFTETPATGTITTQTVSRGYYNQANGNTLQDYGPFTLTITKDKKQTYSDQITLTEKTKLDIKLLDVANPLVGAHPRTVTKYVENPADEALLMATGVLLVRNRQLKRKLKVIQSNARTIN